MTTCTLCHRVLAGDEFLYSKTGEPVCATCNTTSEIKDGLARSAGFGMVRAAWFCLAFGILGSCRVTLNGGTGERVTSFLPAVLIALPADVYALRSLTDDPQNASRQRILVLSWFGIALAMMGIAQALYGWLL